jgi:hypothetical protein
MCVQKESRLFFKFFLEFLFHIVTFFLSFIYFLTEQKKLLLFFYREHFELVNGMSNKYWGWGLEDDEFYVRLKEAGLNVSRPVNITTGTENTFK